MVAAVKSATNSRGTSTQVTANAQDDAGWAYLDDNDELPPDKAKAGMDNGMGPLHTFDVYTYHNPPHGNSWNDHPNTVGAKAHGA